MIVAPSGVKVYIACGVTDMRKGIDGLATLVQEVLLHDAFAGHLFVFRGGKANLIKVLYLGRHRALPFHQTSRASNLRMADGWRDGRDGQPHLGAARDVDRGHRLAVARSKLETGRCGLDSHPQLIAFIAAISLVIVLSTT